MNSGHVLIMAAAALILGSLSAGVVHFLSDVHQVQVIFDPNAKGRFYVDNQQNQQTSHNVLYNNEESPAIDLYLATGQHVFGFVSAGNQVASTKVFILSDTTSIRCYLIGQDLDCLDMSSLT